MNRNATRLVQYALNDPIAAWTYLVCGREGLQSLSLKRTLQASGNRVRELDSQLLENQEFLKHISTELTKAGRYIGEIDSFALRGLYVVVRSLKPEVALETGVAAGVSSSVILRALEDNGGGELYSIDMPNHELELLKEGKCDRAMAILPNDREPGFVVPPSLRKRWHLRLGLSREIMPLLIRDLSRIDLFFHDSEHTYENMMFEYRLAWAHLQSQGLLLSHDIHFNGAFRDFAKEVECDSVNWYFTGIGAIRKRETTPQGGSVSATL